MGQEAFTQYRLAVLHAISLLPHGGCEDALADICIGAAGMEWMDFYPALASLKQEGLVQGEPNVLTAQGKQVLEHHIQWLPEMMIQIQRDRAFRYNWFPANACSVQWAPRPWGVRAWFHQVIHGRVHSEFLDLQNNQAAYDLAIKFTEKIKDDH